MAKNKVVGFSKISLNKNKKRGNLKLLLKVFYFSCVFLFLFFLSQKMVKSMYKHTFYLIFAVPSRVIWTLVPPLGSQQKAKEVRVTHRT